MYNFTSDIPLIKEQYEKSKQVRLCPSSAGHYRGTEEDCTKTLYQVLRDLENNALEGTGYYDLKTDLQIMVLLSPYSSWGVYSPLALIDNPQWVVTLREWGFEFFNMERYPQRVYIRVIKPCLQSHTLEWCSIFAEIRGVPLLDLFVFFNNIFLPLPQGKKNILYEALQILGLFKSESIDWESTHPILYSMAEALYKGLQLPPRWKTALKTIASCCVHNLEFVYTEASQQDLDSLVAKVLKFQKIEKKYGLEYVGFCESHRKVASEEDFLEWRRVNALVKSRDLLLPVFGTKKVPTIFGWRIEELTSVSDFELEGKRQKHCIAGYVPQSADTPYRFFSIVKEKAYLAKAKKQLNEVRFSIQWDTRSNTPLQVKGYCNCNTDAYGSAIKVEVQAILGIIQNQIKQYGKQQKRNDDF